MSAHLADWLNLALRWIHIITGVSWIGTSFYFNWLNGRIRPPDAPEPGVTGELWSVHGGGFYRVVKYSVAPERLPRTLHWFKWEAYATWLSGASLLVLVYYLGARVNLLDPGVSSIAPGAAVAVSLGTIVGAWLVYDVLCRSPAGYRPVVLATLGLVLVTALGYGLARVFSARAAYLHVGVALGTIMAANVFRVIIPAQREMVDALAAGRVPDAARGRQAALRSLHNNYLTLPVLFVMVSGHYPSTYGSAWGWAILAGLFVVGVLTRHWFNLRNAGIRNAWLLPAAVVGLVVLALATAPRSGGMASPGGAVSSFADVRIVIARRCAPCHSAAPTFPGVTAPPGGVAFDTPEQIRVRASRIAERVVAQQTMPLGNVTGITPEERDLLGRWIQAGARLR